MSKPLQKLKALIEKGARNSTNDAKMHQTIHDHSVALGAKCETDAQEAADFSSNDVMVILNNALKVQFKNVYSYMYISDLYDDYFVFSSDYSYNTNSFMKCDYEVSESGVVTLGTPIAVIRKVTYIEPTASASVESGEIDIDGDTVALIETNLSEASRMIKLISPGWGSSGYYSEAVLKRDGPKVFKAGTHNYIDHPTAIEEKARPEGTLTKLASTLKEDAKWLDDYAGQGPGLYATTNENKEYSNFLTTFAKDIGTSIRARGISEVGEADGKQGPIIKAITAAKSVDYVTIPGAGGKVLELFESAKNGPWIGPQVETTEKEVTPMADQPNTDALQESINKMNARLIRGETKTYIARALTTLKVKEAIKDRITANVIDCVPLTEVGEIDTAKFDETIKAAIENEMTYLSSVGSLGKISGFGESAKTPVVDPNKSVLTIKSFQESLSALD